MDIVSKILVVDDRPENIAVIRTMLDGFGAEIISAASGNEALALSLEHDFALALIDVQMPGMDGYETVRLMRKVEKTRYLPVIFLSAIYAEDHNHVLGIEAGAVDFITKPFNSRVLLGKIRIFLELHNQKKLLESEIERRKETELELREAKKKAEESDRLKSAFLANMSHEIRTPLTTIVGMSGLLSTRDYPEARKKEIAGLIEKSSDSLITIINDILDLSKIEAGIVRITTSPVNIDSLLAQLKCSFESNLKKLKKDSVALTLILPDGAPVYTVTDENRLRQILSNFLSNAVKFTHDGFIEFGYYRSDSHLDFFVKDSGEGIAPEKLDTIFNRFHKLNDMSQGTGLGLSISEKLAGLLGGCINVTSEPGKGSVFSLSIPYKSNGMDHQNEVYKEIMDKVYDWSSKSMLIAEDEYPVYFLLENILEPTGIKVRWARSGQEAVDIFSKDRNFDVILLDIRMPGMDGIDTFKELRKTDDKIPIIAQTAFSMSDDVDELETIGFNGYIAKPFVHDDIFSLLDGILNKGE